MLLTLQRNADATLSSYRKVLRHVDFELRHRKRHRITHQVNKRSQIGEQTETPPLIPQRRSHSPTQHPLRKSCLLLLQTRTPIKTSTFTIHRDLFHLCIHSFSSRLSLLPWTSSSSLFLFFKLAFFVLPQPAAEQIFLMRDIAFSDQIACFFAHGSSVSEHPLL